MVHNPRRISYHQFFLQQNCSVGLKCSEVLRYVCLDFDLAFVCDPHHRQVHEVNDLWGDRGQKGCNCTIS